MVGTCSAVSPAAGAAQLWPANSTDMDTCADANGTDNRVTPSEEAAQRPKYDMKSKESTAEEPASKRQRTTPDVPTTSTAPQAQLETGAAKASQAPPQPAAPPGPPQAATPAPRTADAATQQVRAVTAAAHSSAPPAPPTSREPEAAVLLQQYAELLCSPLPQHVLQALNLLLAISRRDGHAQVLAHNPALMTALCSVVHAYIDASLDARRDAATGAAARTQSAAAATAGGPAAPLQDVRRQLVEGQWCGDACEHQPWRAQLAVHAGTVIHNLVQVAHELMTAESLAAVHAVCLRHLPLLHAQPCPAVLELAALLLNVTRATIRAVPTQSMITMSDSALPLVSDAALPLQIKAVAASILSEALASRQGLHLVRHLSARRPHEPFAAAHSLILSSHADGEHAYMVQRRGEAGPAGAADGGPDSPQARLAAQYMPRFWQMHAISCGIRLARELLASVAAGYVGIVAAGAAGPSGERVSRTLQLRVPMLQSSAPASPKVNVGGPQCGSGRQLLGASLEHLPGRSGGLEDREESVGLWDLSPAVSTPASPTAHAAGDRGLRPAWSVAHADTSQPGSATRRKSDSGSPGVRVLSPQVQASHVQEKLRRHALAQVQAEEDSAAAAADEAAVLGDEGGRGAGAEGGSAAAAGDAEMQERPAAAPAAAAASPEGPSTPAGALTPAGSVKGVEMGKEPRKRREAHAAEAAVAAALQEGSGASMPPPAAAMSDTDKSLTLAPLPALLMHGARMPEGIWGELPRAGADGPAAPTDTGSPSLDHMPSFSRWVSMSLSCSVSFGGPVRADSEVRSRRIAAPPAEQDGGAGPDRTESVCSPPSQTQARGDGGSSRPSHPQISLAPPPPLPLLQPGRTPQLGRGVEVPSLDLGAGVCGSSSWLPEAPGSGARGADLWAPANDVLHVPALLMSALCDVATGGRPGAAPAPPEAPPVAPAEVATATASAVPAGPARSSGAASGGDAGAPPAEAPAKTEAANGSVSSGGDVAPDAPAPQEAPPAAVEGSPGGDALDGRTLQGLVMTMDRDVVRGAHEALAVALRVPELTPQVSARQGELLNAMFEDREESTPRQHFATQR
eukprot:jgi/Ulvmu1/9141/UM005_0239.1